MSGRHSLVSSGSKGVSPENCSILRAGRIRAWIAALLPSLWSVHASDMELARRFDREVKPFVREYCLSCHDKETRKAELDLSGYETLNSVVKDAAHWELVLDRLRAADMPPKKAKTQPSEESRKRVIVWIEQLREREARRNAGDPGSVSPRRLSNAEFDYTIRDLTGVDLRPTRAFPIDPANQAGFDNSAESLAMSPALVKKYLQAAREISEHLVLQPDGFHFAPHPVVADTDRDKWAVFRIVDFYRCQPTDYADYFEAAWRYRHRAALGMRRATLDEIAAHSKVSARYLRRIWSVLTESFEDVGPAAQVRSTWESLPAPGKLSPEELRRRCEALREYVVRVRSRLVPEVKNLKAPPIQDGSQTLVLWKNRQMAANRRRFDPGVLRTAATLTNAVAIPSTNAPAKPTNTPPAYASKRGTNRVQAPTPDAVKKGGFSLAPALVTKESSATAQMAASRKRGDDPDWIVPEDPAGRARYEAAFARFADVFPDAFYITERARVYLDAEKEQENAGRLLSAGLHSMTGYFRDDRPLYDLVLDDAGRRELDGLWDEFDMVSSVPQRMHTSFVWFERTDSAYMRDPEFDPYRPEDKSVTNQEKIRSLAALYLAKAQRNQASELAQAAIREHFEIVASSIARVESLRAAAQARHLDTLESFASRAYRRPITAEEREDLRSFYRRSREENGVDHEEAMRDGVVRVLMSPGFLFRMDLVEASGTGKAKGVSKEGRVPVESLSETALASRLSFFLWSSLPDDSLLQRAARGELKRPKVLRAEVRRMLKDPRARGFAVEFAGNWLDFRRFEDHNSVDRGRFPSFDNVLRSAMYEEPLRFFADVVQRDRSVLDFLYAHDTFVNGPLARHYGVTPAPSGTNEWVHLTDARAYGRGGLLPMATFLTANSPGLRTSPVKRGNWVVKRILGERIPPPPPVVPELPADERSLGNLTLRETLERHRANEACAGCHARFDSFGLVFESFGPIGERRETDLAGRPVDTRAEFPGGSEGAGLEGLLKYIHDHREQEFVENLSRKLLAYALGRSLILTDEPLIRQMRVKAAAEGYRWSSLIDTIVGSPQFLNKRRHDTAAHLTTP